MTNYSRGTNFEYKIRDWLKGQNYYCMRAAGSHGPCDLLAFNESGDVMLIQCKTERKKKTYKDDVELLKAVPCPAQWKKLLFVKTLNRTIVMIEVRSGAMTSHSLRSFK